LVHHAYGELELAQRARLLHHLARCSACALEYCRLLADLDGIQASLEDPPAALGRKIRAAVERELRPRGLRRVAFALRRPIPAYALAAALLLPLAMWGGPELEDWSPSPSSGSRKDPVGAAPRSVVPTSGRLGSSSRPRSSHYDAAGPPLATFPLL
jgi:hypothetical protein